MFGCLDNDTDLDMELCKVKLQEAKSRKQMEYHLEEIKLIEELIKRKSMPLVR